MIMSLRIFVKNFICHNSLIRLWVVEDNEYKMLTDDDNNSVCMDHELLNNKVWQSKYLEYKVKGVTDILVKDFYTEAINIVLYPEKFIDSDYDNLLKTEPKEVGIYKFPVNEDNGLQFNRLTIIEPNANTSCISSNAGILNNIKNFFKYKK